MMTKKCHHSEKRIASLLFKAVEKIEAASLREYEK
jgi:hypothetical protein